jgi:uncharacterized protein
MNEIFFNSVGRLRSGWRFLCYLIPFGFLYTFAAVFLFFLQGGNPDTFEPFMSSTLGMTIYMSISLVIATVLGWLCGKVLEGLPLKALGLPFNVSFLKDLLFGCVFGAVSLAIAVFIAILTGGISLTLNQTSNFSSVFQTFASSFIVFVIAALFEEVLFRGYILQTFFRANLAWSGIILTSFFNTFIAGIWFGVAYMKTRHLWITFGLHLTWNWFQGAFFGLPVSGLKQLTPSPLLHSIDQGPTWLTGGNYGIEGGISCSIALIVSTLIIWFLPNLKADKEMLSLTSKENPKICRQSAEAVGS